MSEEGRVPPRTVTIRAPIKIAKGDIVMIGPAGRARRKGWAMALSEDDLERFAFDAEQNPIYVFAAILARFLRTSALCAERGEPPPPLEDIRLSVPELLALHSLAGRVVDLVLDGDKTPEQKVAALAATLGFTRKGWNAFTHFERDAAAHYAEHLRVQMQETGATYEAARDAVAGERDPRTKERLFARGRRRGARPK